MPDFRRRALKPLKGYEKDYLVKSYPVGFVFSSRSPTEEELIEYYSTSYSREDHLSPVTIKRYHQIHDSFEPCCKINRLVDVGCGIGYFLEEAKKRGWGSTRYRIH